MFNILKKQKQSCISAVVVAAGMGTRMGGIDKQQIMLEDVPVVVRSIMQLSLCREVTEIVLVCRKEEIANYLHMVQDYALEKVSNIVAGGQQRQDSAFNGIAACSSKADFFVIHDGARPLITPELVSECIAAAKQYGAAAAGVPVKDTIKVADSNGFIVSTPDRGGLFSIQTPQIFESELYKAAMDKAAKAGNYYTDDCQLIEQTGKKVYISKGSYENIKITTPEDIAAARTFLAIREGMV